MSTNMAHPPADFSRLSWMISPEHEMQLPRAHCKHPQSCLDVGSGVVVLKTLDHHAWMHPSTIGFLK
eukprot:147273-Amphidinium_carterae.1